MDNWMKIENKDGLMTGETYLTYPHYRILKYVSLDGEVCFARYNSNDDLIKVYGVTHYMRLPKSPVID